MTAAAGGREGGRVAFSHVTTPCCTNEGRKGERAKQLLYFTGKERDGDGWSRDVGADQCIDNGDEPSVEPRWWTAERRRGGSAETN